MFNKFFKKAKKMAKKIAIEVAEGKIRAKNLTLRINGKTFNVDDIRTEVLDTTALVELAAQVKIKAEAVEAVMQDASLSKTVLNLRDKNRGLDVWYAIIIDELEKRNAAATAKAKALKLKEIEAEEEAIAKAKFENMSQEAKDKYYADKEEELKKAKAALKGEVTEEEELDY